MSRKLIGKSIVGIVVIGGALGYLVYSAMQSSAAYYLSVDEFGPKQSLAQRHTFRLAGNVGRGSVVRDLKAMLLKFDLTGKRASVPVSYEGVVPENFAEEREVVVEGRLDEAGVFKADKLMTKCESKYAAKVE